MKKTTTHWRTNFYAGLAIVLPVIITAAIVKWLFGTVSNVTDLLLFFLPRSWTHAPNGSTYWWSSVGSVLIAILLISLVGSLARYLVVKRVLQIMDMIILNVPLLNRIYGAIKQINDAFSASNKSSFKQVVLVQFPRPGIYSIGFVTGDRHLEADHRTGRHIYSVFIPTTPNPTSGYLALVPEEELVRLDMSVADGTKFIISIGSVSPPYQVRGNGPGNPVMMNPTPDNTATPRETEPLKAGHG